MQKLVHTSNERRRGVVAVYIALTLLVMLGAAALAVDAGYMYARRAQAQKAADSAALAGAYKLSFVNGTNAAGVIAAKANAIDYAQKNSYDNTVPGTTVSTIYPADGSATLFRVSVQRVEPLFFARIMGFKSSNVGATATASFIAPSVDIPIPTTIYGSSITNGTSELPWNYSIYGPKGKHSYGDNISSKYLDNGTLNPEYNDANTYAANSQGGYNFIIKNNSMNSTQMQVELYDPDCYNANDLGPGKGDFYGDLSNVDEIHDSPWLSEGEDRRTVTQYTLYSDNGTPNDFTDDVQISRYTSDNTTVNDLKWMTPTGFKFNKSTYDIAGRLVNYRMNVATISGSSENGFSLRAGPPHVNDSDFSKTNGTSIATREIMPINFNNDGLAAFPIGFVPASARSGTITIKKFDTDVADSQHPSTPNAVYYTCDSLPGQTFPGTVNMTNDAFSTDTIAVPSNYTGGVWTANYTSGWGDTSTWTVTATGVSPGSIRLVQ